mmetsp:Transcript_41929/g.124427  ORF Transcript_41929/g.124427 Transcript_41929/m.124427 type:complete len:248 (-) Transcript_41929:102-845(-)
MPHPILDCSCGVKELAQDTVRVDAGHSADLVLVESPTRRESPQRQRRIQEAAPLPQEELLRREEAAREERARAQGAQLAREQEKRLARQVEEARRAAEAREAEEALFKSCLEAAKAEKAQQAARKAAEASTAARAAEAAWRAEEERLRKATVAAFLKEYGFSSVTAPKRTLMKTSYAMHKAAKLADSQLVLMLLQEGADPAQQDSRGRTAKSIAEQHDVRWSHKQVIALLNGGRFGSPKKARAVGGA